jgi:hypothetical protein
VCKDCQKLSTKGWHDRNPWFIYKFKHRMPKWADKEQIRHFYEQAKLLTQTTGVAHEVDHIVPLNGKYVSGLHVPHNMRVITKEENYAKLATHESDFNF